VGHGLHLNESTPFGAYSNSDRVAVVAREVAGLRAPVLPQSMYIFKSAAVGGPVTSHQDGTFLYTRPQQTVVGLWLALHDSHEQNGCLWARPNSHREPLRRQFYRSVDENGEVVMKFADVNGTVTVRSASGEPLEEAYLSPLLLGETTENITTTRDAAAVPAERANEPTTEAAPKRPLWSSRLGRWCKAKWQRLVSHRRARADSSSSSAAGVLASSERAREWEGTWPPVDTKADASAKAELSARGFVPLPAQAGDLLVFAGTLDHLSLPNHSPRDRHTFQLHMVEGSDAGVAWAPENWLQYPDGTSFPRI
jgi:hypothetical protein